MKNLPTYLTTLLASVLQKALHLRLSLELNPELSQNTTQVYDLVNCGPNTRFRTSTGLIAHNCLAFGYGLGQRNVVTKGIEAGLNIVPQDGPRAFNSYWSTFNGIKGFANQLERHTQKIGWFSNDFGYRFTPEQPRKAFNGFIQSTVSSIFHWYGVLMEHYMPEAKFVVCVHDENIYMIKEGDEEKFKLALNQVTDTMNAELKWDVHLRFGAVFGKDLYAAK